MENQALTEKPGRTKGLLDNYRSLAIVTALLILSFGAFAQISSGVRQNINAKGYTWKEGAFDSLMRMPMDTFKLKVADSGSVAYKNNLWIWTGYKWKGACSCSGTDTSTPAPAFAITTQPVSQTVADGSPFSFSVAAANGTTPYTYNWFKNGSALGINNATISSSSAASDSDADYYATVTDATSTTLTSNTVHLTVTPPPSPTSVVFGYSTTDPYSSPTTAPTISSPTTITITSGAYVVFSLPSAAADKFWVVKVPIAQPVATNWYHNTDNSGLIPGDVVRTWTVGSFRYYSSVTEFVLTYTDSIQLRH